MGLPGPRGKALQVSWDLVIYGAFLALAMVDGSFQHPTYLLGATGS